MGLQKLLSLLVLVLACSTGSAQDSCGNVPEDYDTVTLERAAAWHINHECLEIGGQCDYYVAFGHALNSIDGCQNATACAKYENGTTHIIGTYDPKVDVFCLSTEPEYSFIGILSNGDGFNSSSGPVNLSMVIKFRCDREEFWDVKQTNESQIKEKAIINFKFQESSGLYVLGVRYFGACIGELPIDVPNGISVGSILLIVLVCIVTVYFAVGSVINYSSGKRGVEVLPNGAVWSQLPTNVKAGFDFAVGSLRCTGGAQASAASVPNESSSSDTSAFAKDTRYGAI